MGFKHTPVETNTTSDQKNPEKTNTVLTGGQTINEPKYQAPEVKATTTSDPNDPTKTVTTLNDKKQYTVTVTGSEFNGTVQAEAGSTLKFALASLVKEGGPAYGSFKYRDGEDNPVAISHVVNEDLSIRAVRKGE